MTNVVRLRDSMSNGDVYKTVEENVFEYGYSTLTTNGKGYPQFSAKYYIYTLVQSGREITVKAKWRPVYFVIHIITLFTFWTVLPLVIVFVLSMMANKEWKKVTADLDSILNARWGSSGKADPVEQLSKLADLKEKKLISEQEYEEKKAQLLAKVK